MAMRSEDDGRKTPPFQHSKFRSPADQTYSPPEKNTKKLPGFTPSNCSEHGVISNLGTREAYRRMIAFINQDPYWNCCTFEDHNKVILWKASVLPVKLTKTKNSTTFFHAERLDLKY